MTGFQKVDEKTCRVTLEGLANGSVEITAALDGHVARLMVSVTAELTIRMSDEIERAKQITVNEAATVPLGLAALDRSGKALTKDLSWTVANAETGAAQIVWKNGVPQSVRGIGAGETTLLITASYRINETETVTVSRIVAGDGAGEGSRRHGVKKESEGHRDEKTEERTGRDHSDGPPAGPDRGGWSARSFSPRRSGRARR